MMRTLIPIALLSAVPVLYGYAGPAPTSSAQGQETEQKGQPVVQNPKPASALAPAADPAKSTPGSETDPAKMAAPSTIPGTKPSATASAADEKTYVIGAEDQLLVKVWNNAELTGQMMVRPDGKITIGLIGEIMASGETPEKLGQDISNKLKEGGYLRDPNVQVSVLKINSKKFYIQGEVNKPGTYDLVVPTRVLEALVNAGGFRDFANKKDIVILRGDQKLHFNYNKVIKGQNKDQNIWLQPGDILIVR